MDHFLRDQIQGEIVETQAEFSISPEVSRAKLKTFTDEMPYYGLLRYIQGLHRLGVSELDLHFEARRIRVLATLEKQIPLLPEIQRIFHQGRLFEDSSLTNVASGLAGLTLLSPKKMVLVQSVSNWDVLSNQMNCQSDSGPELELTVETQRASVYKRKEFQREISKRCRFARCDFKVNGNLLRPSIQYRDYSNRELSQYEYHTEWVEPGRGFRYHLISFRRYRVEDDLLVATYMNNRSIDDNDPDPAPDGPIIYGGIPAQSFQDQDPWVECRRVIAITTEDKRRVSIHADKPTRAPDPGQLLILRHGVVCESITCSDFIEESLVILDGSSLKSDLSGLKSIRDEAFENEVSESTAQMQRVVQRVIGTYKSALHDIALTKVKTFRDLKERFDGLWMSAIIYVLTWGGLDAQEKRLSKDVDAHANRETQRLQDWLEGQSD